MRGHFSLVHYEGLQMRRGLLLIKVIAAAGMFVGLTCSAANAEIVHLTCRPYGGWERLSPYLFIIDTDKGELDMDPAGQDPSTYPVKFNKDADVIKWSFENGDTRDFLSLDRVTGEFRMDGPSGVGNERSVITARCEKAAQNKIF
jgi:hypothetical protein